MKKILIPTDLRVESLITLKKGIDGIEDDYNQITLMYAEHLNDSITELLFYSPKEKRKKIVLPVFNEAITILKNRYEKKIKSVNIEFFHGYGTAALENFIIGHEIDIIFVPSNYVLKPLKNGFDPIPFIKKSTLTYQEISWESSNNHSDSKDLSLLIQ
jgi:hypothetical protein